MNSGCARAELNECNLMFQELVAEHIIAMPMVSFIQASVGSVGACVFVGVTSNQQPILINQ